MIGTSMMDLKRQDFPPGLWVVATPIGNLADLPPRALEALKRASVIYCEDTRRTGDLLRAFGVQGNLKRLDAHASSTQVRQAIERLDGAIAFVSDAGVPAVSDPGAALVAEARRQGIRVTPFPGPSAVTTLLQAAGFPNQPWGFLGFFPRKASDQKKCLEECDRQEAIRTFLWFESPQRVSEAIRVLAEHWPTAQACVGKEMTKLHERFFEGALPQVADAVEEEIKREGALGEWCIGVAIGSVKSSSPSASDDAWKVVLECLIEAGISASDAARRVSQRFGIPRKSVYALALTLSQNKNDSGS